MIFNIEVNNRMIQARKGETILSALGRNGVKVPTLCNMKEFSPTGACRMCVVEVEGKSNLIPSCSYPVEEWMKISTHTPRVLKARKTIVELLLSNHPDDCLYCERNGSCELQELAEDLNIRERRIPGRKSRFKIDKSSQSIIRDPSKCILCGRCVRVCGELQAVSTLDFTRRGSELVIAPAFNKPLNFSNCISCGQCVIVCPTGALTEKLQYAELDQMLYDHQKKVIVQYSPTVAVSIAGEFGMKQGRDVNGLINAALRKIGFDKVFETSFGADLMVVEQAAEFIIRYESGDDLPLITGGCPAWIRYAEQYLPDFLPNISTVRSPQQIVGSLVRTWIADKLETGRQDIYSVSVMPCTAKKHEAQRVELTHGGLQDIDAVLTTRELARLIRLNGIDMNHLEPEPSDEPMGALSSAGKLFGTGGGTLEALMRTIYYKLTGEELTGMRMTKLRTARTYKEMIIRTGRKELSVIAVSGMAEAVRLLHDIRAGKKKPHVVEIMACPYGCVNGGGQPPASDESVLRARMKALYDADNKEMIKVAHRNPQILQLYNELLGSPGSKESMKLLHTSYTFQKELIN